MKRSLDYLWTHRKVVILTFELFWIAVFLLHSASQEQQAGITPFVYVNF